MRRAIGATLLVLLCTVLRGQALQDAAVLPLYERAAQLMESAAVPVPDLTRAGAPLVESARQSIDNLKRIGAQNPSLHYRFLSALRSYLLLTDTIPRSSPLPEESRRQLAELRDTLGKTEDYYVSLVERLERQVRDPDRDNLRQFADENLRIGAPNPARPRVVFLGDSITAGWRLNEYFPDRDFVNRGISGQISSQMLGRFWSDVISLHPSAVVILAGTNDIARGVPLSTIQQNLTMMAELARANNITPLFASLLPISDYHKNVNPLFERSKQRPPDQIRQMNIWISEFSRTRGYQYVNYFPAVADSAGFLRREVAPDGLHPDSSGYRLMAPVVVEALTKALQPAKPPGRKAR